ncbi:glucose dehydrogenase [Patiriisocius marinistellae]|uniref:Glucose dehydrogenase n=1 Tax=Patiriisocius marinistellae TaxID=2494560 RepID=A0A5J4G1S9_9FLAO|nr:PQQ-dependent sugar dehydrogenase [Patiriisocius marinistellae]GEQ86669.1 glucose dehydrogenase [Patiriisocius marinistellae]
MKKTLSILFIFFTIIFSSAQEIVLELLKDDFNNLVNIQHANDNRIFVVEQGGSIKILNPDGSVNATPFINLTSLITPGGEQGLLGLAFHPDYATNGHFFVNYVDSNENTQITRYTVSASNPDIANLNSAVSIISINQPFVNHNGGDIKFGPDGFLYIAMGDGGSGGDPNNNGQNQNSLLGKLLRIDVNNSSITNPYNIPPDNPFVGVANSRDEIWAYGLRNPWKFSFDSETNDLWIADVGQGAIEEINKITPTQDTGGLNYGWRCYEGSAPYNNSSTCPPSTDLIFPIAEYNHSVGRSITGGYVYRGNDYPDLEGIYFFADFSSSIIGIVNPSNDLTILNTYPGMWSTFYEGFNKELYIASYSGSIFKIVSTVIAGVDDNILNTIRLTPNPAITNVNVSIDNDVVDEINISDLKGTVILSQSDINTSQKNIDVTTFASGMYLMTIKTQSGNVVIKKLIIQ